jgi:two-component system, cell cycle sensor histidine kinase and response regulator CckA
MNTSLASCRNRSVILVIDDDHMVNKTIAVILTELGYAVFSASSGEEALEKYKDHLDDIDLFLIDMVMPGMSGGELYTRIKQLKPTAKAILCSGYSINERIQDIMRQGCNGFLEKPFNLSKLMEMIECILNDRNDTTRLKQQVLGRIR